MKTKDQKNLLIDLITESDTSVFSRSLKERVDDFVAEIGGCAFCHRPAVNLCDYVIGHEIMGFSDCTREQALKIYRLDDFVDGLGLPYTSVDGQMFTCDAPMCESCSTNLGMTFFSGKDGGVITRDYCPCHKDHEHNHEMRMVHPLEVETIRSSIWKKDYLKLATP